MYMISPSRTRTPIESTTLEYARTANALRLLTMDYLEHMAHRLAQKEDFVPGILGAKEKVREFSRLVGVRTPETYYRGPLSGMPSVLPEEFVLKPDFASTSIGIHLLRNLGEGQFLNLVSDEEVSRESLIEKSAEIASRYYGEESANAVFILEELLKGHDGTIPPADVRCYSFQGEVGLILVEDHIAGPAHAMYFDGDFLPFSDLEDRYGVAPGAEQMEFIVPAVTPANAREILSVARRVSAAVPSAFVRVDLYDTPKGVYLGELTFFPGTFYYKNRKLMHDLESERLGRIWDAAAERLTGSYWKR